MLFDFSWTDEAFPSTILNWKIQHCAVYTSVHFMYRAEAIPSINYIGRQLDVSYLGREMYGETSIYQIRI